MVRHLTGEFFNSVNQYEKLLVRDSEEGDGLKVSSDFITALEGHAFFKKVLLETINYGLKRFKNFEGLHQDFSELVLNKKYTYEEVQLLLNWDKCHNAQLIGGYKYDEKTNTLPIFINYVKEPDISDNIKYEDAFLDNDKMQWFSKSSRTLASNDVKTIMEAQNNGTKLEIFVRKNKDDAIAKEFYYLGRALPELEGAERPVQEKMLGADGKEKDVVKMHLRLENPVRNDIYEYLTSRVL